MWWVTDFADPAVLLPLALCVGAALLGLGWRRGAVAWTVAGAATLCVMLALKLLCLGCATGQDAFSPSGHTAAAMAVYGGMAALWLRPRLGAVAAVALGAGSVAAVIGATRVALRLHVPAEVVAGAVVGAAGVTLLVVLAGRAPERLRMGRLAAVGLPVVVLLHGVRLPIEPHIRAFAGWMPASVCERIGL